MFEETTPNRQVPAHFCCQIECLPNYASCALNPSFLCIYATRIANACMAVEHFYMLFCTHQVVTCIGRRRKTSAPPSPLAGTNRVMERHRHLRAAAVTDTSMLIQSVVSLVAAPSPQQICKRPRCQFSAARLRSHNIAHKMKIKPFGSANLSVPPIRSCTLPDKN